MQTIHSLLSQLGYGDKECRVIEVLNSYGPSPAATIARLTKISRTNSYDILRKLMTENIIISFYQGSTQFFAIDDIEKIQLKEKQKVTTADELIPMLRNASRTGGLQIQYYVGQEGIKKQYEDILRLKPKEICVFVHMENFYRVFEPGYDAVWTKKRVENNIHARLLVNQTPAGKKFKGDDPKLNRETRYLPKDMNFTGVVFIYDGVFSFFDTSQNIIGTRIENQSLYLMQKDIFEELWNKAD